MIIGTKELISDLEKLSKVDTYKAVVKGIKTVQAEAKSLCPVGDGELRSSIYTSQETTSETVRGSAIPINPMRRMWSLAPARKARRAIKAFHQMWMLHIHRTPGGSMKARSGEKPLKNMDGPTLTRRKGGFTSVSGRRHIPICTRH